MHRGARQNADHGRLGLGRAVAGRPDDDVVLRDRRAGRAQRGDRGAPGRHAEDEQAGRAGGVHLGHLRIGGEHAGGAGGELDHAPGAGIDGDHVLHRHPDDIGCPGLRRASTRQARQEARHPKRPARTGASTAMDSAVAASRCFIRSGSPCSLKDLGTAELWCRRCCGAAAQCRGHVAAPGDSIVRPWRRGRGFRPTVAAVPRSPARTATTESERWPSLAATMTRSASAGVTSRVTVFTACDSGLSDVAPWIS